MEVLLGICLAVALGVIVWLVVKIFRLRQRYGPVMDIDAEVAKLRVEFARQSGEYDKSRAQKKSSLDKLNQQYVQAKSLYERLKKEVNLLEEHLEDMSFGLYKPHYSFDDPEQYKGQLDDLYEAKKQLIKTNKAVLCPNDWQVNGSVKEGAKMIKQESKLMLRAFNGEVDAAVAKVTWNNVSKMEERILKSYQAVNELGSVMRIRIQEEYCDLALSELRLTYELQAKKQEIKEEQRLIREQMREEEFAQREFERAKKAAEADEARYQKALEAARLEIAKAKESEAEAVRAKIQQLEERLAEAQDKLQHAVSMAQLTKSGHVYVISNIGSFGEDIFKIGMTRRLDPTERVDELGSASVPFPYDIHAMIYTVDAPALELAFHRQFHHRRVNQVNTRKEFFRVGIKELEDFARSHQVDIEFTKLAEAREYRETIARLVKEPETAAEQRVEDHFPTSLSAVADFAE